MVNFKVSVENEKENWAEIVIEPLEQGYGHTLGNSLRRCLLTSMPGAAITAVKISGVSHQFSTIPGVVEDVIQIILNLKKVRVKIYGDKPVTFSLQKKEKGQVTAKDINTQGVGEIVNPNQYIATITDPKAKFTLELTVEGGFGYVQYEDRKVSEIGVIPIDAIFTPVLSVNYSVDQTRVGRKTDFDKLTLEILTDGTISPLDAVNKAAEILSNYFRQIYNPIVEEKTQPQSPGISDELLKSSIDELDLPVRISNALKAIEIDTIEKLITTSKNQLMKAKNLGTKSLSLISERLAERGLSLSET